MNINPALPPWVIPKVLTGIRFSDMKTRFPLRIFAGYDRKRDLAG